ncbi:MAG: FAD-dependent oxidoreductase [Proteobacteria bacterium]|nr:FAD-dependent oxidoreductase [Pseudomonadota bacterium]
MGETTGRTIAVIGAGIVGTVCATYLQRDGHTVILFDHNGPGEMTSFGNTGGISPASVVPIAMPGMLKDAPKWLLDPSGPLYVKWSYLPRAMPWLAQFILAGSRKRIGAISAALASLNMPTFDAYAPLLKSAGLQHLFHQTGQLFVYRSEAAFEKDRLGIVLKQATGARIDVLGADDIRQMEPALDRGFVKAHYIESHGHCKNPGELVKGLAAQFAQDGGTIVKERVRSIEIANGEARAVIGDGGRHAVDGVVICAGIWSKPLVRQLGFDVPLETHRGYHVTLPEPGTMPNRMILSVDDKIALTPMEMGLRIAGTVEIAGLDAPPNYARAEKLLDLGRRIFPGLQTKGYTQWMGHRPCTPDSLPVLGPSPRHRNVVFAFGHGHQGLLGASKTGQVTAEILSGRRPSINLAPFSIERFA